VSLLEQQRVATALCMGSEPSEAQLAALGDTRIWALYREMVRNRLRSELKIALRRSYDALGEQGFGRAFDAWLEQAPPRSRPFHGIVDDFARFAIDFVPAEPGLVAWAADLLAYEAALWAVSDMDDRVKGPLQDLSFDAPPCFAPARKLVSLQHAVHEPALDDGSYKKADTHVCVYRSAEDKASRTFVLNPTLHAIMLALDAGELTLTQAVQRVATERKLRVDATFIDGLCTVLADFSERGLLLGSKA